MHSPPRGKGTEYSGEKTRPAKFDTACLDSRVVYAYFYIQYLNQFDNKEWLFMGDARKKSDTMKCTHFRQVW